MKRNTTTENKGETKTEPEFKIKAYPISLTLWKNMNKNKDGKEFDSYSFTIDRTYTTDGKEGKKEYHQTNSLRPEDIAKIELCLREVANYLFTEEEN